MALLLQPPGSVQLTASIYTLSSGSLDDGQRESARELGLRPSPVPGTELQLAPVRRVADSRGLRRDATRGQEQD